MKTIDIIEQIKTEYKNTIKLYDVAIQNFKNIKRTYRDIPRNELAQLNPSLADYDLAISSIKTMKEQILKDFHSLQLTTNKRLCDELDYLMEVHQDVSPLIIQTALEYFARIHSKYTIPDKERPKLNKIIGEELRNELNLFTSNYLEYKLFESLELLGCSNETIRIIFQVFKNSINAKLPKEPKQIKEKFISLGQKITSK